MLPGGRGGDGGGGHGGHGGDGGMAQRSLAYLVGGGSSILVGGGSSVLVRVGFRGGCSQIRGDCCLDFGGPLSLGQKEKAAIEGTPPCCLG